MNTRIKKSLSMFLASCPQPGISTRNVTPEIRSNEKVGKKDRIRYKMAWRGMPCALCGKNGSWIIDRNHPAAFTFGHIVGLTMYGATNIANLTPQHKFCNDAVKRIPDLRGMVEYSVDSLPSLKEAQEWESNGGLIYNEPESLPTEMAMRLGMKGRGIAI